MKKIFELTPVTEGPTVRPPRSRGPGRGHRRGKIPGRHILGNFEEEEECQGGWRHVRAWRPRQQRVTSPDRATGMLFEADLGLHAG